MVKICDLEMAMDFKSADSFGDTEAYLDTETGKIYYISDVMDYEEDELPDDVYDNDRYINIPSKHDMDLGIMLVLEFVEKNISADYERVSLMFRKKGAYSRYKSYLEDKGLLDKWYAYEQEAQIRAIKGWCEDNNVEYSI